MADFIISRSARRRADGPCPTGHHANCPIIRVRTVSAAAGMFIHARFQFDEDEEPTLELECLDEELAREIAGAVAAGMTINGLNLLSGMTDPIGGARKRALCECGNNPSAADGFCRRCRPQRRKRRRSR